MPKKKPQCTKNSAQKTKASYVSVEVPVQEAPLHSTGTPFQMTACFFSPKIFQHFGKPRHFLASKFWEITKSTD